MQSLERDRQQGQNPPALGEEGFVSQEQGLGLVAPQCHLGVTCPGHGDRNRELGLSRRNLKGAGGGVGATSVSPVPGGDRNRDQPHHLTAGCAPGELGMSSTGGACKGQGVGLVSPWGQEQGAGAEQHKGA